MTNSVDVEAKSTSIRETMPPAASSEERTGPAPFGMALGATLLEGSRCEFRVWAPAQETVELHIVAPFERRVPLRRNDDGYHEAVVDSCAPGTRYWLCRAA